MFPFYYSNLIHVLYRTEFDVSVSDLFHFIDVSLKFKVETERKETTLSTSLLCVCQYLQICFFAYQTVAGMLVYNKECSTWLHQSLIVQRLCS